MGKLEPFSPTKTPCPKCGGASEISRYHHGGELIKDDDGEYTVQVMTKTVECLIVKCGRCRYERLMETKDAPK